MIPLTRHLENYLELRHRLGFKLRDATFELRKFVRFAQKARVSVVTTKLALKWATQPTGCQQTRYGNRLSMVRRFAEYLSAVTCQSTPCLHARCEPLELAVRDEPALGRALALHGFEQRRVRILGDVEAELRDLDPDRVQPALLPEHDTALGIDDFCRVRFYRFRNVKLAGDRPTLPHKEIVADHRSPCFESVPRESLYKLRHFTNEDWDPIV